MNDKHDKTWMELARQARKSERHIISGEEADRLLDKLPDEALPEEEVGSIVEAVMSGRPLEEVRSVRDADAVSPDQTPETEKVEEDVLQLNRNKGEEDAAAETLVERLRREALEEDEDA